jgi:hypothetical protein
LPSYLALFGDAEGDQICGEASTLYLRSHDAAANVASFDPQAKIVAILREPAELLRSLHLQLIQNHVESERDLRTALDLEDERRAGRRIPPGSHRPQMLLYSEHVRYVDQLDRFYREFPAEQILVFAYDDFRADNQRVVREIFEFIGVDPRQPVERSNANPSFMLRSQLAELALYRLSIGRGPIARTLKLAVKSLTPSGSRRRLLHAAYGALRATPPAVDAETMAYIRGRYADEVERLSDYLERDFLQLWGYPTRSSVG